MSGNTVRINGGKDFEWYVGDSRIDQVVNLLDKAGVRMYGKVKLDSNKLKADQVIEVDPDSDEPLTDSDTIREIRRKIRRAQRDDNRIIVNLIEPSPGEYDWMAYGCYSYEILETMVVETDYVEIGSNEDRESIIKEVTSFFKGLGLDIQIREELAE